MVNKMKRTTIWLDEQDREDIKLLKERYGLSTDSDAIRLAIRILASSKKLRIDESSQDCENNIQDT